MSDNQNHEKDDDRLVQGPYDHAVGVSETQANPGEVTVSP